MADTRFQLVVEALYRGGQQIQKAQQDIRGLEQSSRSALERGLQSEKIGQYNAKLRQLSQDVLNGSKSFAQAENELSEFKNTLGLADNAGGKFSGSLKSLAVGLGAATAAFGTVAVAAKATWDTLKEGAALEAAQGRFENVARSINTTADALMVDLRAATRGLVSDADLVAGATDMMSLGLASTHEETVRLTNVVGRLGLDMQQVILTFANNSKMRLDALGLSISDVDEKTEKFLAQGFSKDKAFDLAVLEALEDRVALLGDASETTAGKVQIVENIWHNAVDAFQMEFAEGVANEFDKAADAAVNYGDTLEDTARRAAGFWARITGGAIQGVAGMEIALQIEETKRQLAELNVPVTMSQEYAVPAGVELTNIHDINQQRLENLQALLAPYQSSTANPVRGLVAGYREAAEAAAELEGATEDAMAAWEGNANRFNQKSHDINQGLEGMAQHLRDVEEAEEAAAERAKEMQEAMVEAARRSGEAFNTAIGQYKEGNFADALVTPERTVSYTVGGLGAEQKALLEDYTDLADRAAKKVRDLENGVGTFGMEQDKVNEALEKARGELAYYQQLAAPLAAVTGEVSTSTLQMAVNTEAAHAALYEAASAAGADAEALALLGVATGQMTEAQAEAAIKAAALQAKITELGEAIAGGMSVDAALTQLNNFIGTMDGTAESAANAETHISDVQEAYMLLGEAPPVELKVTADVSDALANIGKAKAAMEETGYGYTSYTAALDAQEQALLGADQPAETTVAFVGDADQLEEQRRRIEKQRTETTVQLEPETSEVDRAIQRYEETVVTVRVQFVQDGDPSTPNPGPIPLARGGPVNKGDAYVVGDGGRPELFVPWSDGYVFPSVPPQMTGGYSYSSTPVVIHDNSQYTHISNTRESAALVLANQDSIRRKHYNAYMGRDSG